MFVDVSCRKCGQRKRLDVGEPATGQGLEDHIRLINDRLMHQPSFGCFGDHFELSPPLPSFWQIHWDSLAER